jgi:hypothetical protein
MDNRKVIMEEFVKGLKLLYYFTMATVLHQCYYFCRGFDEKADVRNSIIIRSQRTRGFQYVRRLREFRAELRFGAK